jgi:hypothetical protein
MQRRASRVLVLVSAVGLIMGSVPATAGERHRSVVTLDLRGSLIASGRVTATDGTRQCQARREVLIQNRGSGGGWQTVERNNSRGSGSFRIVLPDEDGSYRALVKPLRFGGEVCTRDTSPTVVHGGGGGGGNCHPSYPTVCIPPPPPDLDCGDIPYRGFQVVPPDPHGFDGDNDGVGCES